MKSLCIYTENSIKHTPFTSFIYEAKLDDNDKNQISDKAKYWADSFCLKFAAIDFFTMILNGDSKESVVDFMENISKGVSSFNDKVPGSINKYAKSETNVTDGDWRGWYTSIKGYVVKDDWSYDNQGEKNDFYDEIEKDGGNSSLTILNKTACENLYEMFMKYLSDKKVCKEVIKHWKDNLKIVKTNSLSEIKELIQDLKDRKDPNYRFTPKTKTIDEKIRAAEHEIWLGKLHFVKIEALIHICTLLKNKENKEAVKFILESLRTLENFNCKIPEYLNGSKKIYSELYISDIIKIYRILAKETNNTILPDKEFGKEIGLSDLYYDRLAESNVNKFIDVLDDMIFNEYEYSIYDKVIKELKKEQSDKNYTMARSKMAESELKDLKAEEEQGQIDMNDKQ